MELIGFKWVLRGNSANSKVNDINDFEELKMVRTIEWESALNFFKNVGKTFS